MSTLLIPVILPLKANAQLKPLKTLRPLRPLKKLSPLAGFGTKPTKATRLPAWLTELEKERQWNLALAKNKAAYNGQHALYTGPVPKNFIWLFLYGLARGIETANHANPYNAQNPHSSAFGAFQMTNEFYRHYSIKYFGYVLPKTPTNQKKVAYAAANEMFRRHNINGRSLEMVARYMAKEWYGGLKRINASWDIVPEPRYNSITLRQHADKVIQAMKKNARGKNFEDYINKNNKNN